MAFTGVAALVSAGTAATASMVLVAVAEIGLAMTVVGGITGSKTLMKIGGVMSLVGGVGGMIANAGAAAGGAAGSAAAAESAITGEAAFGGYAAEAGSAAAAEAGISAGAAAGESVGASGFGADLGGQSMRSTMPDLSTSLDMAGNAAPGNASSTMSLTPGAESAGLQAPAVSGAQTPVGVQDISTQGAAYTPYENGFQSSSVSGGAPQTSSSFFDTFSKFADKNKGLLNNGMQLVGGAMKGANEQAMWDEKMALEQQRLKQTSYANSVANWAPRTGIISGAR